MPATVGHNGHRGEQHGAMMSNEYFPSMCIYIYIVCIYIYIYICVCVLI